MRERERDSSIQANKSVTCIYNWYQQQHCVATLFCLENSISCGSDETCLREEWGSLVVLCWSGRAMGAWVGLCLALRLHHGLGFNSLPVTSNFFLAAIKIVIEFAWVTTTPPCLFLLTPHPFKNQHTHLPSHCFPHPTHCLEPLSWCWRTRDHVGNAEWRPCTRLPHYCDWQPLFMIYRTQVSVIPLISLPHVCSYLFRYTCDCVPVSCHAWLVVVPDTGFLFPSISSIIGSSAIHLRNISQSTCAYWPFIRYFVLLPVNTSKQSNVRSYSYHPLQSLKLSSVSAFSTVFR